MKNRYLAGTIALLGAVPAAHAGQVTLYGRLDTALQYMHAGGRAPVKNSSIGVVEAGQAGSRFGLRGSEDLSSRLSTIFTLEQGFNADTGTQGDAARGAFNRQSFVGLQDKGLGALTFGRQYNPTYDFSSTFSAFGSAYGLAAQNVVFSGVFVRYDKSAKYTLPQNPWGVRGSVLYSNNAGLEGVGIKSTALSSAVSFDVASVSVLLGFDRAGVSHGLGGGPGGTIGSYVAGLRWKSTFGLEAAVMYGQDHGGRITATATGINQFGVATPMPNATYDDRFKAKNWLAALKYMAGANTIMLSYSSSSPSGIDGFARQGIVSAGYRHDLSKRTGVFAILAHGRNGNYAAAVNLTQARLGIVHLF